MKTLFKDKIEEALGQASGKVIRPLDTRPWIENREVGKAFH